MQEVSAWGKSFAFVGQIAHPGGGRRLNITSFTLVVHSFPENSFRHGPLRSPPLLTDQIGTASCELTWKFPWTYLAVFWAFARPGAFHRVQFTNWMQKCRFTKKKKDVFFCSDYQSREEEVPARTQLPRRWGTVREKTKHVRHTRWDFSSFFLCFFPTDLCLDAVVSCNICIICSQTSVWEHVCQKRQHSQTSLSIGIHPENSEVACLRKRGNCEQKGECRVTNQNFRWMLIPDGRSQVQNLIDCNEQACTPDPDDETYNLFCASRHCHPQMNDVTTAWVLSLPAGHITVARRVGPSCFQRLLFCGPAFSNIFKIGDFCWHNCTIFTILCCSDFRKNQCFRQVCRVVLDGAGSCGKSCGPQRRAMCEFWVSSAAIRHESKTLVRREAHPKIGSWMSSRR